MLYQIDYTRRSDMARLTKYINHAADETEAITRFMDWFHSAHRNDAARPEKITTIEFTGDLSQMDVIDAAF